MVPLVMLNVVAVWWVAIDAGRRKRNWYGWAGGVAVFGPPALIAWLVARRRWPESHEHTPRTVLSTVLAASPLMLLSVLIWFVVSTHLVQVARVEGQAMSPTLLDQDRLLVNRSAYISAPPRHGDVVMMRYPANPDRYFVKRVVGTEGDIVQISDGRVQVNGAAVEEPFVAAEARSHEDWGPAVVPEGYCFVMGDRRNNSSDSRHWGFVPRKYIVGRVVFRWWPLATAGRLAAVAAVAVRN